MNKLTKAQTKERDDLLGAVDDAQQELEAQVRAFNDKVSDLWEELISPAVEGVKDATSKFNDFRESVAGDMRSYYEEKSEKWQEGDNGQAYSRWLDAWEEELEEMELGEECPELSNPDYEEFGALQDRYSVENEG